MRVARVALDVPLCTLFDYAMPEEYRLAPDSLVGRRVVVPFGRARSVGIVLESDVEAHVAERRIRAIGRVFDDEPPLPGDVLEVLRFASDYYHHPVGQVLLNALPQKLRRVPVRDGSRATKAAAADTAQRVTPPAESAAAAPEPQLTGAQQRAVHAVLSSRDTFAPFVLHGVTGGGKTEVYLQVVAELLRRGRQALVLVPEINLTPQLTERFRGRFPGVTLVTLHSHLAEGERMRAWRAAQDGVAAVVIGTRLAVFAPLPRLGAIVVDEEHDASYKQQEGLRYSARDLALLRAKLRGVPVVLGSATPSLESYANAMGGRYRLLELPSRPGARLPAVRCLDTRGQRLWHGLSGALLEALQARLERGEQSLLFVNRRGYAPVLMCLACAWTSPCTRCSARLVLHTSERRLRCHYCGHEEAVTRVCPTCGNQDLTPAGHGTQRLESALREALPAARVLRIDRDTTRRRDAFATMQARIRANEVDILVGTQMLAKGHDFPRLTLVGVVNADGALYTSDFRASERLYAQLTQVAGRAGRSELAGEVLIQSNFPTHPLYEAVCRQDYAAFATGALDERRQLGFPPYSHHALLRAEAARRERVDDYLARAAEAGAALRFPVEIYDPVPPLVARVGGRERGQLLVQSSSRNELQRFLSAWYPQLEGTATRSVRWSLDVDPLEV
jgi:primosomal protein N' (replication factor Y)